MPFPLTFLVGTLYPPDPLKNLLGPNFLFHYAIKGTGIPTTETIFHPLITLPKEFHSSFGFTFRTQPFLLHHCCYTSLAYDCRCSCARFIPEATPAQSLP